VLPIYIGLLFFGLLEGPQFKPVMAMEYSSCQHPAQKSTQKTSSATLAARWRSVRLVMVPGSAWHLRAWMRTGAGLPVVASGWVGLTGRGRWVGVGRWAKRVEVRRSGHIQQAANSPAAIRPHTQPTPKKYICIYH